MLYRSYQRISFGYLGCFNCAFENDKESCEEINKTNICGQKDNKRNDKVEFIFKELFDDNLKKEAEYIKSVKVREKKESELL